jgi:hypothetical protein
MAGDLIPPPSPAGRPSGDADAERERAREREEARRRQGGLWSRSSESETGAGAVVEDMEQAGAPEPAAPRADSPYRSRFGLALGALVGIGIATLALGAAVYVGTGGNGAPDGWSSWRPASDDGVDAAQEIADHVAAKYRLANGDQIVGVQGGPLEVLDIPLEVALRTAPQGGDIDFIDGNGLMYTLNGLGPKGTVSGGTPSSERGLLLRREALELALYTFRYVEDVDLVVALLPPRKMTAKEEKQVSAALAMGDTAGAKRLEPPTPALFYRPGDLEPQLEIPLHATIPAATPRPETIPPSETRRIQALTASNLFSASFTQGQDQRAFLVLDRLPE